MQTRILGRSGMRVSELCLGTMTFGKEADEAASAAIIDHYLAAGGNFVDTADVYNGGASEEIVGRALGSRREQVVLATKGRLPMGSGVNDQGAGRRHLTRALDASLRRLGTEWIDLYQVHWPDPTVPLAETLSTLDSFVRAGKIRAGGLSNYLGKDIQKGIDLCDRHGWAPIVSHQPQYSLLFREIELDTLPLCHGEHIAVLPWSPLGGGVLTGKYAAAATVPTDTRVGASTAKVQASQLSERNLRVAEAVAAVAAEVGKSSAQVALNWVLHRPGVTAPILGARTVAQLDDNLGAQGWQLGDEHLQRLDVASRTPLPYPHNMYRFVIGS
ncbi:MAG: aldo/keto reductase [Actinomycetota bacterium]|nr:aldo/keto reductase [Actinomycetota bacterium]